jgi:hypothetical protein
MNEDNYDAIKLYKRQTADYREIIHCLEQLAVLENNLIAVEGMSRKHTSLLADTTAYLTNKLKELS